jgi:long-chain acyl-CoA synthetase
VLDKVYNAVQSKIKNGGFLKRTLFAWGLRAGYLNYDWGFIGAPFYCKFIFSAVQKVVGGRVRLMYTGSAPLSAEIQKFMQTAFDCPVRQV